MANIKNIRLLAERLRLGNLSNGIIDLTNEQPEHLEFLELILQKEVDARDEADYQKRRIRSQLPAKQYHKELSRGSMSWQVEMLEKLDWVHDTQNIVIIGKCNTGKTSLAAHVGMIALKKTMRVYYCKVEDFLCILKNSEAEKYKRILSYISTCGILIIDDTMYTSLVLEDLRVLYHGIMRFNEALSLVVISNRELSAWIESAADKHIMETLVDRLTGYSQIVRL